MIVLTSWVKCLLVFYPGSNFINLDAISIHILEAILSILFRLARSWLNIGWFSIPLMIPVSIGGDLADDPSRIVIILRITFLVDFRVPALLHILMSGLVVSELAVESLV